MELCRKSFYFIAIKSNEIHIPKFYSSILIAQNNIEFNLVEKLDPTNSNAEAYGFRWI